VLSGIEASPDLGRLSRPELRGGDLIRLVLVELETARQLARIELQLGKGSPVGAPAVDGRGDIASELAIVAERVEQVALPALVEQALLLVLAMDLDERPDNIGESRSGDGLVIEPRRRATCGRELSGCDQRLRNAIEEGRDPRCLGAVSDERGVGARPRRESERVDDQALAGSGR
jgi:hypothetical protein